MDADQESLLSASERAANIGAGLRSQGNNSSIRWRRNLILFAISFSIALCLSIYLYLNMVAFDGVQKDASSFKPLSRRKPMLDHESIFSDSGPSMIRLSDLLAHCVVALRIAGREVVKMSLANNERLKHVGSKGKTLEGVDDIVTGADMKSHQMIVNTIKDSYRRLNVVSEEDTTTAFENTSLEDDILPIDRIEFARLLRNEINDIEGLHAERAGSLIAQHETLVWIDPLDATKEYSENLTEYVTLMACVVHKSVPIAGVIYKPFTNETFWSMSDISTKHFYHSNDVKRTMSNSNGKQGKSDFRIIVSRSHAGDVENILEKAYGIQATVVSAGGSGYKTVELIGGKVDAYLHLTHIKKWDICAPHALLNSLSNGNLTDTAGNLIQFGDPKDKLVKKGLVATLNKEVHQRLVSLTGPLQIGN